MPLRLKPRAEDPCQHIERSAGSERHDDVHRLAGEALRRTDRRQGHPERDADQKPETTQNRSR